METTLNIGTDVLEQITRAAQANGISCSEMINFLINKVMGDNKDPVRLGRMVQYQNRRRSEEWHVFHVQVREDIYEYWLDLRKLLKMSVSLILAYAVKKYIGTLINKLRPDNNRFKNYIIVKDVIDSVIVWKLAWGIPFNLEKFIAH